MNGRDGMRNGNSQSGKLPSCLPFFEVDDLISAKVEETERVARLEVVGKISEVVERQQQVLEAIEVLEHRNTAQVIVTEIEVDEVDEISPDFGAKGRNLVVRHVEEGEGRQGRDDFGDALEFVPRDRKMRKIGEFAQVRVDVSEEVIADGPELPPRGDSNGV